MSTEEQLYWSRLNTAVSSFCLEQSLQTSHEDKMICSLVGEELEWCGSHSYLFMASRYMQATSRISELEKKRASAENNFSKELANSAGLRKSLKQLQLAAEDTAWQQQEDLAHASNLVELEKSTCSELRDKISELQAKLVEMDVYVRSDSGTLAARLEEELAVTRLQLVALQVERDSEATVVGREKGGQKVGKGAFRSYSSDENLHGNVLSSSTETEHGSMW